MRRSLITLAVVMATNTGHAHDEANCRDISNLLARLSCYDESHAGQSTQAASRSTRAAENTGTTKLPTFDSPPQQAQREADSSFGKPQEMFSNRDTRMVAATLTSISKNPMRATRLYLDNDQIWQLSKDRALSASVGDKVHIKTGTVGGYLMSINEGSWFRVKRID